MDEVKNQFARHLESIGFEFGNSREAIFAKLRQRMGEERFSRAFPKGQGQQSASGHEEFYEHFQDLTEANLMRSLDASSTLDSSFDAYKQSASSFCGGARVLELGCWTGGLASLIAARHPKCSVIGADMGRRVIDADIAHYKLPNLKFIRWNYRFGKPEELEPASVLLCALGVVHPPLDNKQLMDPQQIRNSVEYRTQRDHAIGYFGIWRSAALPEAKLFAVLRVHRYPRFLAWIDAAQRTGWTPRLECTWGTKLDGGKLTLPGLLFEAAPSNPLPEDVVFEAWARFAHGSDVLTRLESGAALALYRSFANGKSVLARREYRDAGRLMGDEVGLAGGIGYVFSHDAVANFRLLIVSTARADQLASGVRSAGSSTPITDAGVFKGAEAPHGGTVHFAASCTPFFAPSPGIHAAGGPFTL